MQRIQAGQISISLNIKKEHYIRENGEQAFAEEMTKRGEQTIKK
jgi:hypothetical protein